MSNQALQTTQFPVRHVREGSPDSDVASRVSELQRWAESMKTSSLLTSVMSGLALLLASYAVVSRHERAARQTTHALQADAVRTEQLRALDARIMMLSARLDLFEQRFASASVVSAGVTTIEAPSSTPRDGVIVYDSNATVRFGDFMISSPSGVMVSDQAKGLVTGELWVESPDGIMESNDAFVDVSAGKVALKSPTIRARKTAQPGATDNPDGAQ